MIEIKLLVVEEQTIVRRAICVLLESADGFTVVGEADNGLDGVHKTQELKPDVVIMEIDMPVMDGISAVKEIKKVSPATKIIMLTICSDEKLIMESIKSGANGCVEKNSTESDLFTAIKAVYKNKSYLSPSICKSVLKSVQPNERRNNRYSLLTRGERALLRSIAKGMSRDEIANKISTNVQIIDKHLKNVMLKLGVTDFSTLKSYAVNKEKSKIVDERGTFEPAEEEDIDLISSELQQKINLDKDSNKNLEIVPKLKSDPSDQFNPEKSGGTEEHEVSKVSQREDAVKIYNDAYSYLEKSIHLLKNGKKFDIDESFNIVKRMITHKQIINSLSGKALSMSKGKDFLISNMVNVSIYSVKIGMGYNFKEKQLIELGVAGLLHDVGMFFLSESIIRKNGTLNNDERKEMQKHPLFTRGIVEKYGDEYLWLANTVVQEHERWNRQGYPEGLSGSQITKYAGIIGLMDVYEALTSGRLGKDRLSPSKAAQKILNEEKGLHDGKLLKLLMVNFSYYAVDSYVRLNSSEIAKVIATDEKFPLQPIVEVINKTENEGQNGKKVINLRENNSLYIVGRILEEHLASLLTT